MIETYVAVMAALATAGALLVAAGLRGASDLASMPSWVDRVRRWWLGTGASAAQRRTRQATMIAALVVGVATFLLTAVPVVAMLAGAAVPTVRWLWLAGTRERHAIARAEAVAGWTARLKDQLATGSGLVAAIIDSAETAPLPIVTQVHALALRLRSGTSPQFALQRFADEVDDTVAEQVVAALLLHLQDRGEQISEVLASLSSDAARVVAMRREVDAKRAQPRMTVRFMIVLAGVVTGVLAYMGMFTIYRTASGQLVLLVLAGGFAAALAWVNAMSRPPAPQRFLTSTATGR